MSWRRMLLIVSLLCVAMLDPSGASAADDLPSTFSECVVRGGDVRRVGEDITCRLIETYDFRVYGKGTTECGETIDLEVWGETRAGVVTYFLAPGSTIELPEAGLEDMKLSEEPIPCLGGDPGSDD